MVKNKLKKLLRIEQNLKRFYNLFSTTLVSFYKVIEF